MAGSGPPSTDSPAEVAPAASLVAAPPPPLHADPARLASYVRAAMHQDRTPGELLVVLHPKRRPRVPHDLFDTLRERGWGVHVVETQADRVASVTAVRDAFLELAELERPVDLLVIAGDGTLDHHLLTGAFWSCYPDLVTLRPGEVQLDPLDAEALAAVPSAYRETFFRAVPNTSSLSPDEETVKRIWALQLEITRWVGKRMTPARLARKAGVDLDDPVLAVAVWSLLAPEAVTLRPTGFDLEGLAAATQEETFQGLYPFLRSIVMYPAGTASDNAMFAGVPGWLYAQVGPAMTGWRLLEPLRRWLEARARDRFVRMFTEASVVVPARYSLVRIDGSWQAVCSHAVGGPGSGHLFAADLGGKSHGLMGYAVLVPRLIVREGMLGSTVVEITSRGADGQERSRTTAQLAEAMFTNRTFIAGLGSIPSTEPTSFAGSSTLLVAPPIFRRRDDGEHDVQWSGLLTVVEGAIKGMLARALPWIGVDPGRLAGGGEVASAWPEHQLTLTEGASVTLAFRHRDGRARRVPTQISGDPYVCSELAVRVAWGPLPLLAAEGSQLLASARRTLGYLRVRETWNLEGVTIGGMHYFRHDAGAAWTRTFSEEVGLFVPPLHLRRGATRIQEELITRWQRLGTGSFVDTSRPGFHLDKQGRYAHNADQSAHLVVLREESGTLLVRQVRARPDGVLHECQTRYRRVGSVWVIKHTQTRRVHPGEPPQILQESHFSRTAEALEREAPSFFPVLPSGTDRDDG